MGRADAAEAGCSLNKNPNANAEDPPVAAGTMNLERHCPMGHVGRDTVGVKQVFVSRLVGATHFELVNSGAPISAAANHSTRPDITFSGNTPYVTWREESDRGSEKGFFGHFVSAANPTFVLDESGVPLTPTAQADVREPISSACTANPFNHDGGLPGRGLGTPFFLFTNGSPPRSLFANAYQPETPVTGGAAPRATAPDGKRLGQPPRRRGQRLFESAPGRVRAGDPGAEDRTRFHRRQFRAPLPGCRRPPRSTRAVAVTDFGTFLGADQTLRTGEAAAGDTAVGDATVSGRTVSVPVSCTGQVGATCRLALRLVSERFAVVGRTSVTLTAGQSQTVPVELDRLGADILARHHQLNATLGTFQLLPGGHIATVSTQSVMFEGA